MLEELETPDPFRALPEVALRNEEPERIAVVRLERPAVESVREQHIVVVCQAGFASSLAAASLRQLGLVNATDLAGGFEAWKQAGQPVAVRSARRAPVST